MTKASKVGSIIYTRRGGVYMPRIQCNKGDLYQEYQGTPEAPSGIAPDFTQLRPELMYMIASSRGSEGFVTPVAPVGEREVKWYFDDTLIEFGSDDVSTTMLGGEAGHFKYVKRVDSVHPHNGLIIQKNLVKASGGAPCSIKASAKVAVGNTSDIIQCTYPIPITVGKANSVRLTIGTDSKQGFVVGSSFETCVLKAILRSGKDEVTANVTYKWFQLKAGAWSVLEGQTKSTLSVTKAMVATNGQFKCEATYQSVAYSDVETVTDTSDLYDIRPCPTPANETIEENSGTIVSYEPVLVERGGKEIARGAANFIFTFLDTAGVPLSDPGAKFNQCNEAMCIQADGNVGYVIESKQ